MIIVILLQVVLPIGLIFWLILAPAKNSIGYLAQALSTGLVLLALYLVALWMLLPWWLPLVYSLVWIMTLAVKLGRGRAFLTTIMPTTPISWMAFIFMITLGSLASYVSWQGIQGRQPPGIRTVDISQPLGTGIYLIANGGSRILVNSHMMTLNSEVNRFRSYRGQSYGVDIIKIDRFGFRSRGIQPRDPKVYDIYGESVVSPCDGSVIATRNDRPDMPVPIMDHEVIEGNYVLLSCDDFVVLLAHFQPGSLLVKKGDTVKTGDLLGVVGNSGKTGEPHLHISAQLPGTVAEPLSGEPLAIMIDGTYLVRNDRVHVGRE